jgi:flagellar biosynthetic protein FliR
MGDVFALMPLFTLPLGAVELFLLVHLRVFGLLLNLPVFGAREIPLTVRAGLAAVFSLMIAMALAENPVSLPTTGAGLVTAAVGEFLLGLMAGWLLSWVLEAVVIGAQMVGFQMGFAIVNVIDPATGTTISVMAGFQARVALLVFLVSGIYRPFLQAIATSFDLAPLGFATFGAAHLRAINETVGLAFKVSVTLAGAPIVALLIAKMGLGLLARTVPQMNVFIVGFPLTIGVGILVTALVLPVFVRGVDVFYAQSLERMLAFMRAAAP